MLVSEQVNGEHPKAEVIAKRDTCSKGVIAVMLECILRRRG